MTAIGSTSPAHPLLAKIPTLASYPFTTRRFARGQALVRYREPLRDLSFMVEGRAKVFRVMENGRCVLHSLFEGVQAIGDLELLLGYPYATTDILALSSGLLLSIPLEPCAQQLLADSAMLRFLGGELARKLERSSRQGAQNLMFPLSARLAAYIVFAAQGSLFTENLVHVSELLATSYRHLLRTLRAFCDQGILARCPAGYRIVDLPALSREGDGILREDA